jgi:Zn-dependent protease with chaperone function
MYYLIGICVALAAFFAANTAGALVAACAWRAVRGVALRRLSPGARADLIFALRTVPTALALATVTTLLIPAYFSYEPAETGEAVSAKLALLALVAAAGFALAAWRCVAALVNTRRVSRGLMRRAAPLELRGIDNVAAFRVEHALPIVAVVGLLRPRLFVASRLFDTLGEDEMTAALAHELGHVAARDNLKRTVMRACRDVLPVALFARTFERAWSVESESAADEFAARAGGTQSAISLASALVKIARLMPEGNMHAPRAASLLVGDGADVAERVDRLLHFADAHDDDTSARAANVCRHAATASYLIILAASALLAAQPHVMRGLYAALEHVVSALS